MHFYRFSAAVAVGLAWLTSSGLAAEKTGPRPATPESECASSLSVSSETSWETRVSTQMVVATPQPRNARIRWAAIEFLFRHAASHEKIEPAFLHLLERIQRGEVNEVLESSEVTPYRNLIFEQLPAQSTFLKRMERESQRLSPPVLEQKEWSEVLSYTPKHISAWQRLGMRTRLVGQSFDRFDTFLAELKSYPQFKDRLEFFIAVAPSLGLWTWPEAMEAVSLIDGEVPRVEAIHAISAQIFTPADLYTKTVREDAHRKLDLATFPDIQKRFVWLSKRGKGRRMLRIGLAATLLAGGALKVGEVYFEPARVAAREAAAAHEEAQRQAEEARQLQLEMHQNFEAHDRTVKLLAQSLVPWQSVQSEFLKTRDLQALIQLARASEDPLVREEITIRSAGPLAPLLSVEDYYRLIDGFEYRRKHTSEVPSVIADPAVRYDLWVHYLEHNKARLSLSDVSLIVGRYLAKEPVGLGISGASLYADYVLSHPEKGLDWWEGAVRGAPDTETGDGLALAYVYAHPQISAADRKRVAQWIHNRTTRDRAIHADPRPPGVETPGLQ